MSGCETLDECPFYNNRLDNMPDVSEAMKRRYCLKNFTQCAIYIVRSSLGRKLVPADLHPDDMTRVKILLSDRI
jgi:hypothetical protein